MIEFGNFNIIIANIYNRPRLIEIRHSCDCEYCHYNDIEGYECSECNYKSEYIDYFEKKDDLYICPKCGINLILSSELEELASIKRHSYKINSLVLAD